MSTPTAPAPSCVMTLRNAAIVSAIDSKDGKKCYLEIKTVDGSTLNFDVVARSSDFAPFILQQKTFTLALSARVFRGEGGTRQTLSIIQIDIK